MTDARRRVLIVDSMLPTILTGLLSDRGIDLVTAGKEIPQPRPPSIEHLEAIFIRAHPVEAFMPVYSVRDFDHKPYGKNARRALRGGRHD
jgi:hypothetical protein